MNCIAVITCLGLLCGTLFALDVTSNPNTTGATENPVSTPKCLQNSTEDNCNNKGVSSAPELSQFATDVIPAGEVVDNSDKITLKSNNNLASESMVNIYMNNGSSSTNAPSTSSSDNSTDVPPPTTTATSTTAPTSTSSTTTTTTTTKTTTTIPTTTASPTTTVATTTTVPVTTPTPTQPTLSPNTSTTNAPVTTEIPPTAKPANDRQFDGPSFIGGIVFALGVTAIAFVAWKFYKARTERNYHTL